MKFTKLNIKEAKNILRLALSKGYNVLISGRAGIGKSSIVQQVAEELGKKTVDIRAINMDIGDLITRIPANHSEEIRLKTAVAEWVKELDENTVLILDEFDKSTNLVLRMFYQILLDRKVENYKLPNGLSVVAIINTVEDGEFTTLEKPLLDRFHFKLELITTFDDFMAYALDKDFDPRLLAFLQANSEWLYRESEDQLIATPRRLEFLSNVINGKDVQTAISLSRVVVSDEFSKEFAGFLHLFKKIQADKIYTGKEQLSKDFATRIAQIVAVSNYIGRAKEKDHITMVLNFLKRLNNEEKLFFIQIVMSAIARETGKTKDSVKRKFIAHEGLLNEIKKVLSDKLDKEEELEKELKK